MRHAYKSNTKPAVPPASSASALGNPGDETPATVIGEFWFWLATETIKRVIEEAGLTPGDDPDELKDAIATLISNAGGLDTNAGDLRWLRRTLNLSDLANAGTARNNLSVYSRTQSDGRYLRLAQNLADVANAGTARGNLGAAAAREPRLHRQPARADAGDW